VPYSENVVVHYDIAKDSDCDGLPDGVEKAWGSNPLAKDSDADGADDFVEMFLFTNPVNPDTDGDGFKDAPANVYGDKPLDATTDNCPSVYNPTQVNSDGHRRDAGPNMPDGIYASNPNQDKLGDLCDADNDNDQALDLYELGHGTDPLKFDTDGDAVGDGVELRLQMSDPSVSATDKTKFPIWNASEQVYYRGCHINIPGPGVENDVDGDGITCPTDLDSDNGIYTGVAKKPEVADAVEAWGYGTGVANKDTDADGCEDWVEISDVNGDRTADSGDQLDLNRRVARKIAANAITDLVFDLDKNAKVDSGDQLQMNQNTCGFKPGTGGCGAVCQSVPNG
jgi:hypothetical protein